MTRLAGSLLDTATCENLSLPTRYSRGVLTASELNAVEQLYIKLKDNLSSSLTLSSIFYKYSSVTLNGRNYKSSGMRSKVPFVALTSWDEILYGSPPNPLPSCSLLPATAILRLVNVHYYMKVFFLMTHHLIHCC